MEKTTSGEGIACSNYANCYIGCSCNTSNGWYSSCSSAGGTDCKSVTDTRYTGVNAMSASSVGDVTSLTDGKSAQSTTGTTQVVSLNGGVSTMSSSGATTCYKKKTCSEGGYSTSIPDGKKCDTVNYNGYTCYTNCKDNNYDFKVFTSGTSDSGTVTSMNTTVTLSGNGYNKSIKQSVNSASDTFSFTNLPSGTYTVEGTTTLRVKSGSGPAKFCAHNVGSTFEVTKQVTIGSGGVSSVSLSFTCNDSSGGIKPILPDPCTGSCSGDIPYPKTFNGNKCCCPTAGEINSRKCNCCINTAKS